MPYITSETVKQKREAIKKAYPDFKFSIVKEHYSSITVSILEGPVAMPITRRYESVNHFYINDLYKGQAQEVLNGINKILNEGNGVLCEDGDYGAVPRFYVNISIGNYEHPYKMVIKSTSGNPVATFKIKNKLSS